MTGLERSLAVIEEHGKRVGVLLADAAHAVRHPHPYALHQPAPVIVTVPEHTEVISEPAHETTAAGGAVYFGEDVLTHGGEIDANTATGPTAPAFTPESNN